MKDALGAGRVAQVVGSLWGDTITSLLKAVVPLTFRHTGGDNDHMKSWSPIATQLMMVAVLAAGVLASSASDAGDGFGTVYWCPNKPPNQQYSAKPAPGCSPIYEKQEQPNTQPADLEGPAREPIKLEGIEAEISLFFSQYNKFLECCASDVGTAAELTDLEEQATRLIDAVQDTGFAQNLRYQRGTTVNQIMTPIVQARTNLRKLKMEQEQMRASMNKRHSLGFEEAGRETLAIQETEESISKDFKATKAPSSAKTGVNIGATPAAGAEIGKTPAAGTRIGGGGTVGVNIGTTTETGAEIGATGSVGTDIGATGRAGTSIGESNFNSGSSRVGSSLQPSSVGSSLNDSTVGSSLGSSSVGSSLQDSTLGSTLGGSTTGSSLQNRGTAPQ